MDLAQMEAIAIDLAEQVDGLTSRVSTLEDNAVGSFAPQNTFFIGKEGKINQLGEPQQNGIAILENNREPAIGDFHKPGGIEFELLQASGIIVDSIGALPTIGEIALPGGTWLEIPTPFVSMGAGKFKGAMGTENKGQNLLLGETPTFKFGDPPPMKYFDLVQLKGAPGVKPGIHCNFADEEHRSIEAFFYNDEGTLIGNVAINEGATQEGVAFPASGIWWVLLGRASARESPTPFEYEVTFSNVEANAFEFPTFKLPEGFLYLISVEFEFVTKESTAFSAFMRAQIVAELEPPEDIVNFSDGTLMSVSAAAGKVWDLPAAAATSLWIPPKQSTPALGGVKVLKPVSAPGNETEYAWSKQKVTIQQMLL